MKFSSEDQKLFFRIIEILYWGHKNELAEQFLDWIDKHENE